MLEEERQKVSFDVKDLSHFIYGGE
jgi:hypothetical protein